MFSDFNPYLFASVGGTVFKKSYVFIKMISLFRKRLNNKSSSSNRISRSGICRGSSNGGVAPELMNIHGI